MDHRKHSTEHPAEEATAVAVKWKSGWQEPAKGQTEWQGAREGWAGWKSWRDEPATDPTAGSSQEAARTEEESSGASGAANAVAPTKGPPTVAAAAGAAVAATAGAPPALAASQASPLGTDADMSPSGGFWGLDFFQRMRVFTAGYKQHNAALKWFRNVCEQGAHPDGFRFSNERKAAVGAIQHPKGLHYQFDDGDMKEWCW